MQVTLPRYEKVPRLCLLPWGVLWWFNEDQNPGVSSLCYTMVACNFHSPSTIHDHAIDRNMCTYTNETGRLAA